jgi:putative tryptophan/tyrosine transport system substrate-binding protein
VKRRDFISLLGGAAAAWPLVARAQQGNRPRRIGVLMNFVAGDHEPMARIAAFLQGLQELGWSVGRNVAVEYRLSGGDNDRVRRDTAELVSLAPDVILATGGSTVGPLQQATGTVPIVFVNVVDPVGAGYVESLARPGRNITGFSSFEYSTSGKWLELLREIAPSVKRVAVLRDASIAAGAGELGALQSVAASIGVELVPVTGSDVSRVESALSDFARGPNNGLIVTTAALAAVYHELIVALAARNNLPAIYALRLFVDAGGLISYGPDQISQYRRAAAYVDRVLKGEKPGDLPVQNPTKFDLVINLKTAKALGLTVPPSLLARADEVIE